MAYFMVLSWHSSAVTEESQDVCNLVEIHILAKDVPATPF
jgi:hypothetical protein